MNFWSRGKSEKIRSTRVYADAAAATPLSKRSRDELVRLLDVYGNAGGLHKEAVDAKAEMDKARKTIAEAIGAHEDEIIFTASGTEGNNMAIGGVLRPLLLKHGELKAITSAVEHQSVLQPLAVLDREGLYTAELPVDSTGLIEVGQLAEEINDQTVFVSIQLVNSEVGTIEPIREVAKVVRNVRKLRIAAQSEGKTWPSGPERASGSSNSQLSLPLPLYFHCDASQAPLWMDINVEKLGVDLMTLDAQKVLGPKGMGVLYVRRGTAVEPIMWGGVQEFSLRAGTPNVPLAGAFAVALEDAQNEVEERAQKVSEIRDYCFEQIKKLLPDVLINGPELSGPRVANSLNISIPRLEAQMAVIALDALGVAASTRSACTIGNDEPSHVIKALGTPPELAGTAIRLSFLPDITKTQADFIAESLAKVAAKYRQT